MRKRLAVSCLVALASMRAADTSFSRDVQPLLQKNCSGCHQPSSKASGLDLTSFAAFKTGGKRGPAFAAGTPDDSLIVKYMTGALKPSMPMGQPVLPKDSVDLIRDWIRAGAHDDSPAEVTSNEPTVYHQPPVVTALRFSPDGSTLAVSGNREVLLHRADGSGVTKRLQGKAERILSLTFSADGKLLVAGGGTPARFGEIQIWDTASGKQARSIQLTADTVFGASLSPDGKKIAVGAADNSVYSFDAATGKQLYKITSHENWVLGTVFGVDSKRIVSVGRDRSAKLIDAEAGQFLENVNQLRGELSAIARNPKKDEIVVGGDERIPYLYMMDRSRNMKVGEEATLIRKLERQQGPIAALDWSADGKRIAIAGGSPEVNIYDADTGARVAACKGHAAGIYAVAFSPDGAHLATGGFDGQVRLYRVADCGLEKAFIPVPIATQTAAVGDAR